MLYIIVVSDGVTLKYRCGRSNGAASLLRTKLDNKLVRVFRRSDENNVSFAPKPVEGSPAYRYDGLYGISSVINQITMKAFVATLDQNVREIFPRHQDQYLITFKRVSKYCAQTNACFKRKLAAIVSTETESVSVDTSSASHDQKQALFAHQAKLKSQGKFTPAGQLLGKYKTTSWNHQESYEVNSTVNYPTHVQRLVHVSFSAALTAIKKDIEPPSSYKLLHEVKLNVFLPTSRNLFVIAHQALTAIIPKDDMEHLESSWAAQDLARFWRPKTPKVILLCESHSNTPFPLMSRDGPRMHQDILPEYHGPRNALFHVHNIWYGEDESSKVPFEGSNSGSPQFWKLLGTIAYGYNEWITKEKYKAAQKQHNKDMLSRVEVKYNILVSLKDKGFWLLDTMVFGWYLQQAIEFQQTAVSNHTEVVKKTKQRPPANLKHAALALSWELWTKHLVREAAMCGELKCIFPLGKSVGSALTRDRLLEAITVDGKSGEVGINAPAPNSWSSDGYDGTMWRLSVEFNKFI